ncbi:MAG: trimethylamine methyltransferase family protein [Desulfobacterales bacterium]|jgi:trimethylamine--corrinoid protein Co-methyltransferase
MNENSRLFTPTLNFLSEPNRDKIHEAALTILAQLGMKILHAQALELLAAAGCKIENDHIVKIPSDLVLQAIDSTPKNIAVYDREANHCMDVGGRRTYFGTGSDLIFTHDAIKNERRMCVLDDVCRAARVADALPNIDFIMSFAHPSDCAPQLAYLFSFQAMAANSSKPIVSTARGRDDLAQMWQICCILRGSARRLREKPLMIHYTDPISPLTHPFYSLDKLLFCAETSVPLVYSAAPIAGTTAPMTIAGHVAQGLAECLCGLVIHQLKTKGAPFVMGMGPAVLDMATGECSYNAPEFLLSLQASIEMSCYYDLPNWGYAGTTDAQIPDEQAVFEAGLETFVAAMAGSNLNHDVGYMDFGRTGSLELMLMMDEAIDQVRRLARGIPVDDDVLALDVIREARVDGDFLTHPHTLKHLRQTQWRPGLISRMGYEEWQSAGATSLRERSRQKVQDILRDHRPAPIPAKQAREIEKIVDQFTN